MTAVPALIRDPRAAPVIAVDEHLPALPPAQLQAGALRRRFAAPHGWQAALAGDGSPLAGQRPAAAAAVLVALVEHADGLRVLLTRRTDHLRDHAGQISFPGGRTEPGEHDDPALTALREAEEEVGLARHQVEVIGCLPVYTTVTAFVVTPVIALVRPPLQLRPDPAEVAETFEVPLAYLMTPAHHRRHRFDADGQQRHFLSMPWHGAGHDGRVREHFIWGATAAMLRNLYHFLSDTTDPLA